MFQQVKTICSHLHAWAVNRDCAQYLHEEGGAHFSPCEPDPVVYAFLSDVLDYLPGPATPDNSLEG